MKLRSHRWGVLLVGLCLEALRAVPVEASEGAERAPYFGFTPFPYDTTLEAVVKTREIVAENSTLYAFHMDDGIPWEEALEGKPFPEELQRDWKGKADAVPPGHKVYLGLAPLGKDRETLAPASKGSKRPGGFRGSSFDDEKVMKAYLNYARRAVEAFSPDYLNLGIEAGELAGRDAAAWDRFTRLFRHVRDEIKKTHPSMQIGISFGLHSLIHDEVAARARSLVEDSDYLGLSFYPYASAFGEKFGAKPLPTPPNQWREPLEWARKYTTKPIAICETGYSSVNVDIPSYDLHMSGDSRLQKDYVEDLGRIAVHHRYLFVVWFLVADYDELYRKIPEGDGSNRIWRNIGLLDGKLEPKPAWESWKEIVGGKAAALPRRETGARPTSPGDDFAIDEGKVVLGFSKKSDLETPDDVELTEEGPPGGGKAVRWEFDYEGRWHWATRSIERGLVDKHERLRFWVRSDREMPLFVQLEEKSGEAFFDVVVVGKAWQEVRLELSKIEADPQKRRDGRLDAGQVARFLIADNAGAEKRARGKRSIWISDLVFER